MTLAVFDNSNEPNGVTPARMAPFVTWAAVLPRSANGYAAAGIKTILYTDPVRASVGDPYYTNDETTFAHDCSGARVTIVGKPKTTYLMDPASTHLHQLWQSHVNGVLGWGDHYDAVFYDTADIVKPVSALPCNFDQTAWTAATNGMNASLGHTVIYNGLGALVNGTASISPAIALNPTSYAGELEGCYSNPDPLNPMPKKTVWKTYENTELAMTLSHHPFFCRGLGTLPAATSQVERIYMYASFLLSNDPDTSIISENFATPSHVSIEPESQFVATQPVGLLTNDVSSLSVSNMVYARQFGACYLGGRSLGRCAVIINSDFGAGAHPFPYPGVYSRTLTLQGASVFDGGTASETGPPPPSKIPGSSAVIAIQ